MDSNNFTTTEQRQAAYALNLCAVSVSQIVEYQDINIMEQEYEAILNNLNLENMPKDQALLDILTQILNVITFFRIQDGDKKLIEKRYEHKMKNAIWKAIPNPGVFFTGMSPLSIGLSLAYSVGTGYMNYRNAKAENNLELEEEMWKLQRSAIEQLNALRRELFTTAWRLAEKYDYPDEYRLTENQIKQYNQILMDPDPVRKYERLDYIKDKFEAYPAFWYQLGHAANSVVWTKLDKLNISDEQKQQRVIEYNEEQQKIKNAAEPYIEIAKDCFKKYFDLNDSNLLRTDDTVATCALEYIDLLDPSDPVEKDRIIEYLRRAVISSGDKLDILQLCAFKYLQLDLNEDAMPLLRHLVTEDYNKTLNGQILSGLYVKEYFDTENKKLYADYMLLKERIGENLIFDIDLRPFSESANDFMNKQRILLKKMFENVLTQTYRKYSIEFNKYVPCAKPKKAGDEYYLDSNRDVRCKDVIELASAAKISNEILGADILERYSVLINELFNSLISISMLDEDRLYEAYSKSIKVSSNKDKINRIDKLINGDKFIVENYRKLTDLTLNDVTEAMFREAVEEMSIHIDSLTKMSEFAQVEKEIIDFCEKEGLKIENRVEEDTALSIDVANENRFNLLGVSDGTKNQIDREKERVDKMKAYIRNSKELFVKNDENIKILLKSTVEMGMYVDDCKPIRNYRKYIVAVLDDKSAYDFDLVFTQSGIIPIHHKKCKQEIAYDAIERTNKGIKIGSTTFDHRDIDLDRFMDVINKLERVALPTVRFEWQNAFVWAAEGVRSIINAKKNDENEADYENADIMFVADANNPVEGVLQELCGAIVVGRKDLGMINESDDYLQCFKGTVLKGELEVGDTILKVSDKGEPKGETNISAIAINYRNESETCAPGDKVKIFLENPELTDVEYLVWTERDKKSELINLLLQKLQNKEENAE